MCRHLDTWSPAADTVWEGSGGAAMLEGSMSLKKRFESVSLGPASSLLSLLPACDGGGDLSASCLASVLLVAMFPCCNALSLLWNHEPK